MATKKSPKTARKTPTRQGSLPAFPEDAARFFTELMLHLNSRRSQISMSALAAVAEHNISLALVKQSLSDESCAFLARTSREQFHALFAPHLLLRRSDDPEQGELLVVRSRSVLAFHFTFFRYHADFATLPGYLESCGAQKNDPRYTKKNLNSAPVDFLSVYELAPALSAACRAVMRQYPVFDFAWSTYLKAQPGDTGTLGTIEKLGHAIGTLPQRVPTKLIDCVVNTMHAFLFDMTNILNKATNGSVSEESATGLDQIYLQLGNELQAASPAHLSLLDIILNYIDAQGSTSKQRTSMERDYAVVRQVLQTWLEHQGKEAAARPPLPSSTATPELNHLGSNGDATTQHRSPAKRPSSPESKEEAPAQTPPSVRKTRWSTVGIDPDLLLEAAGRPPSSTTTVTGKDPRLRRQQPPQQQEQQSPQPQQRPVTSSSSSYYGPQHRVQQPSATTMTTAATTTLAISAPAPPTIPTIPTDPRRRAQSQRQAPPTAPEHGVGLAGSERSSSSSSSGQPEAQAASQNKARPASVAFDGASFDPDLPFMTPKASYNSLQAGPVAQAPLGAAAAGDAFGHSQRQPPAQQSYASAPSFSGGNRQRELASPPLRPAIKQPQLLSPGQDVDDFHRSKRRRLRKRVRFEADAPQHTPDPSTGWLSVNEYKQRERTKERSDLANSGEGFSKGQFAKGSLAARMDRAIWCVFQGEDSLWDSIFALIDNGVGPNFGRPVMGETALLAAAYTGRRDMVEKLLSLGASPDQPDKNGATPASLARMRGHTELSEYLESAASQRKSTPKKRRMSR